MKKTLIITTILSLTFNLAHATLGDRISPQFWEGSAIEISKEVRDKILFLSAHDPLVTVIPVTDNGEPLVDLLAMNHPRIKLITDIPGHAKVLKDLSSNTIEEVKSGHFTKVRRGLYENLLKMLDYLPPNIGIAYVCGYQNLDYMKGVFDDNVRKGLNSGLNLDNAYNKAAALITPFVKGSTNSYASGAAIAMTLFKTDKPAELLDLGVIGSNVKNTTRQLFAHGISDTEKKNRRMLVEAATRAGFASYGELWYFYSYGDQIWALLNKKIHAIYGLVTQEDRDLNLTTKDEYLKSFR